MSAIVWGGSNLMLEIDVFLFEGYPGKNRANDVWVGVI